MASSNYNVNLKFTADTNDAKRQIQSLQQALQAVAKMPGGADELFDDEQLNRASQAALELQQHLSKAVNVNTGKLDLSRFSTSLKASNKDLTTYCNTLLATGEKGQEAFLQLATAISTADAPVTRVNAKLQQMGVTIKNAAKWQISSSVIHGFMGAVQSAYGYAEDLNKSLNDIRIVTGQNIEQMDKFAEKANKAAKSLSATTLDYTNASLIYYQQGLTDQEVEERTNVTIKMANAAGVSASTVSDQLTAVWNNFYDGSKSLEYYADVMTALGAATASSTDEISEGLEKFASVAETVGLSYEYATAALATVTATTRQSADVVGTAFKTLFARLQDLELGETLDDGTTLGQYSEALYKVGINIKDTNGEMKDMDDILDELGGKWQSLSKDTQVALAQTVAGTRQYTQLVSLMDNWDYFQENVGVANSSSGALQEQADIYAESWEAAKDRVTAAAEAIYADLVSDDFFIDLLNGVEKALEGVKGLVEGLGGMKGILISVSSIFMTMFANKVPDALNNLRQNIMVLIGQAEKEMLKMQNEMNTYVQYQKDNSTDVVYTTQLENVARLNKMKQTLALNTSQLTDSERKEWEMRIENVQAMQEESVKLAQLVKDRQAAMTKAQEQVNHSDLNEISELFSNRIDSWYTFENASGEQGFDSTAAQEALQVYQGYQAQVDQVAQSLRDMGVSAEETNRIINILSSYDSTEEETAMAYNQIADAIETATANLVQYTQRATSLDSIKNNINGQVAAWEKMTSTIGENPVATEKMKATIQGYLTTIQEAIGDTEDLSQGTSFLGVAFQECSKAVNSSGTSGTECLAIFSDLAALFERRVNPEIVDLGEKTQIAKDALSNFKVNPAALEEFISNLNLSVQDAEKLRAVVAQINGQSVNPPVSPKFSQTFTLMAGTAMSVYTAINSIKNAISTMQDPDASGWEKFGAVVQTLIPVTSMLGAVTKLNTKLTNQNTTAKGANAGATGAVTVANGTAAVATNGFTAAVKKSTTALLKSPLLYMALAVAAVAVVVDQLSKHLNKLKEEHDATAIAANNAAEAAANLASAYEEAKTEYENLKTSLSDYEDALDGIKKLRYGTAEFTEELTNANEQALTLLRNYSNIIGNRYSVDGNGLITIDSSALADVEAAAAQEMQSKQIASTLASQKSREASLVAQTTELNRNVIRSKEGYTEDDRNETAQARTTGAKIGTIGGAVAGGVTGAALGAKIGTVIAPVIGTAIGAAVGLAAGALAGQIVGWIDGYTDDDSETEEEKQAIKDLTAAYKKQGSSVFESAKKIQEVIGCSEDLAEALYENKESVQELCDAYIASEKASRAENEAAVKGILADNNYVQSSKYGESVGTFIADEYGENGEKLVSNYAEQFSSGDEDIVKELWTRYAAQAGLTDLDQLSYEGVDKNGNVSYKYYDSENKEWSEGKVASVTEMATLLASLDLENLVNSRGKEVADILLGLQQDEVNILEAFLHDDASELSFDEIISFTEGSISDPILQDLDISSEELSDWMNKVQDSYEGWMNRGWFQGLTDDEKKLVISNDFDKDLDDKALQEELERLQRLLADHPLEATIEYYNAAEDAIKNGKWSDLKDVMTNSLGLSEEDYWEILSLKDEQAMLDKLNELRKKQTDNDYANATTPEQAAQDVEDAQAKVDAVTKEKQAAEQAVVDAVKEKSAAEEKLAVAEGKLAVAQNGVSYFDYAALYSPDYEYDAQSYENAISNFARDYATQAAKALGGPLEGDYFEQMVQDYYMKLTNVMSWYSPDYYPDVKDFLEDNGYQYVSDVINANADYVQAESEVASVQDEVAAATKKYEDAAEINDSFDIQTADDELNAAKESYEAALIDVAEKERERANRIETVGLDEDTVEVYRDMLEDGLGLEGSGAEQLDEWLEGLSDSEAEQALDDLSITVARLTKGLKSLGSNWKTWNKIMSDSTATIDQIAEILPDINDSIADILDWDLSDVASLGASFYQDNWSLIKDVYNGVDGAIEKLAGLATQRYILNMNLDTSEVSAEYESIMAWLGDIPDLEIGTSLDTSGMTDAFQALLDAGAITADQLTDILSNAGYDPDIEYKELTVQGRDSSGQGGYVEVADAQGNIRRVPINSQMEVSSEGTVIFPVINGKKTVYTGGGGVKAQAPKNSSSGGGGSNKKIDITKKSDVVDRYKEINDSLDDNSQAMDKASKAADRLYGASRLKQMKKVNDLIQDEIKLNKTKREEALAYLATDKADLLDAASKVGLSFTFDEDGDITNYTEQMTKLYDQLHAAETSAMADNNVTDSEQEKIDAIQEKIDAVTDAISQYEETKGVVEDLDDEIQEAIYEWQDNNLEMLQYELELKITVNDEELELIEYYLNKVEGDVYKIAEAWDLIGSKVSVAEDNLVNYSDAAEKVYSGYFSDGDYGEYSQKGALDELSELRSNILNELTTLQELDAEKLAYYGNVLGLVSEELSEQTSKFDDLNTTLDHYKTLMDLTGNSKNYTDMKKILSTQADVQKNQADIAKREYEMYAAEVEDYKAKMEAAQAAGDTAAYELYKENYEAAYGYMVEAQDNMYSTTEAWLETMKELYQTQLEEIGKTLEESLTGGTSFDELTTAMERSASLQEEYLTTTNQIYETNKLMRQAQQEIDKTTNSVAKKKLAAYIQETEQLQNQGKLSNYELEIQQAKYDLLLAEIALEEAQSAKSTVRLQRDSEGNLGYVYTADSDKIADAEQELADKQNALYNIGLEGANEYSEKYAQTMQDMYETLSDLHTKYLEGEFASEDEYNNAVAAAKEYYYQKLEDYSSLYSVALTTDSRVVKDAWSSDYNDMMYKVEGLKGSVEDYLTESKGVIEQWAQDCKAALEEAGLTDTTAAVENINTASKDLRDTLMDEDGLLDQMEKQVTYANNVTTAYAEQRKGILELIKTYEDLIEKINGYQDAIRNTDDNADDEPDTDLNPTTSNDNGSGTASTTKTLATGDTVTVKSTASKFASGQTMASFVRGGSYTVMGVNGNKILIGRNGVATGWVYQSDLEGFDTGGYTGSWGSYGKLAMLHEKELVLNAQDTENFLASMEVLDHILEVIDLQSASARIGGMLTSPTVGNSESVVEQHVEITANFPNATDHSEIEEAFNNLINQASQFANRK